MLPDNKAVDYTTKVDRAIIYGEPFAGKTTFAASIHNPDKTLIISTDGKYKHTQCPAVEVKSLQEFLQVLDELYSDDKFELVIIDLMSEIWNLFRQSELDKKGINYEGDANDHGKTWHLMRKGSEQLARKICNLDKKLLLLFHAEETVEKVKTKNKYGVAVEQEVTKSLPNIKDRYYTHFSSRCQLCINVQASADRRFYMSDDLGTEYTFEQAQTKLKKDMGL
jgi:hypothetical protein